MTVFSAQEILARHNIAYTATKKNNYTTNCPTCSEGYLNVKIERDGVAWYCHHCEEGGGEPFEKEEKRGGLGPITASFDYDDETGKRFYGSIRRVAQSNSGSAPVPMRKNGRSMACASCPIVCPS
jgi:hypothetical protein